MLATVSYHCARAREEQGGRAVRERVRAVTAACQLPIARAVPPSTAAAAAAAAAAVCTSSAAPRDVAAGDVTAGGGGGVALRDVAAPAHVTSDDVEAAAAPGELAPSAGKVLPRSSARTRAIAASVCVSRGDRAARACRPYSNLINLISTIVKVIRCHPFYSADCTLPSPALH